MGDLTENFSEWEFRDGPRWMPRKMRQPVPVQFRKKLLRTAVAAQEIRDELDLGPWKITSGWRKSFGAPGSHHFTADAFDGFPKREVRTLENMRKIGRRIYGLMEQGVIPCGEVGVYPKHIHVSFRGPLEYFEGDYK